MNYKTNEIANILGVTTNTIRRYETNGYIKPEKKGDSGYRCYTQGDVLKIGLIRLLRKCGFTHEEIENFNGKSSDEIKALSQNKLDEIDKKIQRLKFLRHWLKDNIQMIDVCKDLGDGFTLMDCPPVYYVIYSKDNKLLNEKERLKTISDFMYVASEVQSIKLLKKDDKQTPSQELGWAIKEMDITRTGLQDMFSNDTFIEYYPMQKCLYGALSYPSKYADKPEEQKPYKDAFDKRKDEYLKENGLIENGDIMMFFMGSLGECIDWIVCIPIKEKKA